MALRRTVLSLKTVLKVLPACVLAAPAFASKPAAESAELLEARRLIVQASEGFVDLRRRTGYGLSDAREGLRVSAKLLPDSKERVWVDFKVYWADLRAAERAFLLPRDHGSFSSAREKWQSDYGRLRQDVLTTKGRVESAASGLREAALAAGELKEDMQKARHHIGRKKSAEAEQLRESLERLEQSFSSWERPVLGPIAGELGAAGPELGSFLSDFDAAHISMETQLDGRYSQAGEARDARVQALEAQEARRIREAQERLARTVDRALGGLEHRAPQWELR